MQQLAARDYLNASLPRPPERSESYNRARCYNSTVGGFCLKTQPDSLKGLCSRSLAALPLKSMPIPKSENRRAD